MYNIYVIILYTLVKATNGARILAVFPGPSISHQVIFRPLTQELVRRGHQVTVITPNPTFEKGKGPENLTEIDVHDISYKMKEDFVETADFGRKDLVFDQIIHLFEQLSGIFADQTKSSDVQSILNDKNISFDLLLIEACVRPTLIFSHLYKVPVIQVSSFGMMLGSAEIVGSPTHPFLYPTIMHQRLYNLSFWEKIDELYKHLKMKSMYDSSEFKELEMFESILGVDLPSYNVLKNNVDMLFLNIHPIWTDNQPLPMNVISIWGIHKTTLKELPQDLKSYLDSSKKGVIYMSLGSNAPSSRLPQEILQIFIRVFSQLQYDVLWKWEKDELPGKPKNVKISKWFPQSDLLYHPNIKLFITQGGLQSTEEAINAGVPLIGMPMHGDQWYNVEKYAHHRIGIRLEMDTLTETQLKTTIDKVMMDKSYQENIVRLRSLLSDEPQKALDRAVWWTEYVLRHGGAKHLRSPAANMSWMEYYEIQFIVTILLLIITCKIFIVIFLCFVWKYVLHNFIKKHKIKKS
ncbi:UDP-glucosyltransferase 2-like isoform X1 [Leptidea sinapis]|uniref:UDP-glucosyltransferase 2-like isoform X1 n=1 Tax=Leptidea sinapis TaxID=189913 RepID=UPI00213AEA3B|nr:UDP-glucosyltransferase 2-like isoform X1 [Leptidea sinapis]XP_050683696.1 UDP-glucosyltransferase 2-like isoform X1 [Leptidea sinapis]